VENTTDNNRGQDGMNDKAMTNEEFDRQLDAALSKFAAVEPRAGLEERVLANLCEEQKNASARAWWRWPAIAFVAAGIAVALSLAWRSGRPMPDITLQQASAATSDHPGTQIASNRESGSIPPHGAAPERRVKPHAIHRATVVALAHRLDQFPSPQPLSEQEKILARYVTNYPEHAALIAQARTEELRRDSTEEMDEAARNENSQQRNK
jgi:hypothetical protein